MQLREEILRSEEIVKVLVEGIDGGEMSLKQTEERIVEYVNRIGQILLNEVIKGISEPVRENRVMVNGEEAVFDGERNLRFLNRFGGETVRLRRCYKYVNKEGGWYPLDEKLGTNYAGRFSPLMTYLQALFGASESYERSEELLSESIGFHVSATAIQRNTEMTGARIDGSPYRIIPGEKREEGCEMMVVAIDGTMSPQIREKEGVLGRKSLREPTEYKECNLLVVEKHTGGECRDRWVGGCYGKRTVFEEYVRRSGLALGQMKAREVVFLADGAKTNWEIQRTNFPEAIRILDYYHASEHLAVFCGLLPGAGAQQRAYKSWGAMLLAGEVLQVIAEMKEALRQITDKHAAWGEINYFENNRERMHYLDYRERGFPIGSGLVEGACKFVVGKRFKGNGMRWKKADNEKVLKVRIVKLNGLLPDYFRPKSKPWTIAA
jgi:hypothetical protein